MLPVAITGMGVVCALGDDALELAASLHKGESAIGWIASGVEDEAVDIGAAINAESIKMRCAALSESDSANGLFRKLSRRAPLPLKATLVSAVEAYRQSGLEDRLSPDRIGLIVAGNNLVGSISEEMFQAYSTGAQYINPRYALLFLDSNYIGILSRLFGLRGPASTVGATSASGNVALLRACEMLALSTCDACIVAAPPMHLARAERRAMQNAGALYSGTGPAEKACRPFDRGHAGFVYGEAAVCVVLERADNVSAKRRLAKVVGGAVCLDAHAYTEPNADGELLAMRQALASAGATINDIDFISSHGTSSPLGDRTEVNALLRLLGTRAAEVPINALKGMTGHCLSSSSLLELVAVVVQLSEGLIHRNANLEIPISDACRLPRTTVYNPWLRRALSNAFAFGGINSSVIIERGDD